MDTRTMSEVQFDFNFLGDTGNNGLSCSFIEQGHTFLSFLLFSCDILINSP